MSLSFQKINGIVSFMRMASTIVNPDELFEKSKIPSLDRFEETQLEYMLVREGIDNPHLKELFFALKNLDITDIRLLNSGQNIFDYWALIGGALYYAKSIRRLIRKQEILDMQEVLTPDAYRFIFDFAQSKLCIEDFPLGQDFKKSFLALGYHIIGNYALKMHHLIGFYLFEKISIPDTNSEILHLRISNEYKLLLAQHAKEFILLQSE